MKIHAYAAMIAIGCIVCSLHAADSKKTLYVNTMKTWFEIPFSDDTTIYQLKSVIQNWEGIPINQQLVQKREWICGRWFIPQRIDIELEDNQTCLSYGLQNKDDIYLYLKRISRSLYGVTSHATNN